MSYYFHKNRELYFEYQRATTQNFIIPFIEKNYQINEGLKVLEIGCGEAGVLKAFTERGCLCTGVELSEEKLARAKHMMQEEIEQGKVTFINKDIYSDDFKMEFKKRFDLIILKDVIEHINNQQQLLSYLYTFLKKGGQIFFSFPPWQMPFGGHQQMCSSFLKKTPYFHLFPMFLYKQILKQFNESKQVVTGLEANKKTGISIERFERILIRTGYRIRFRTFYLFNPIYKYKFNLEPKEQFTFLSKLPYLRNFVTTAMYYLIEK